MVIRISTSVSPALATYQSTPSVTQTASITSDSPTDPAQVYLTFIISPSQATPTITTVYNGAQRTWPRGQLTALADVGTTAYAVWSLQNVFGNWAQPYTYYLTVGSNVGASASTSFVIQGAPVPPPVPPSPGGTCPAGYHYSGGVCVADVQPVPVPIPYPAPVTYYTTSTQTGQETSLELSTEGGLISTGFGGLPFPVYNPSVMAGPVGWDLRPLALLAIAAGLGAAYALTNKEIRQKLPRLW